MDVLVEKHDTAFITSVYKKPTFTGQYLRWNSFNPRKQKICLINTLVHRALMICSKGKLSSELDNIRSIMAENGYPDHVVNSSITKKIRNFRRPPSCGPKKCPVYLHLPWLGAISTRFEKQVASAVQRCYFSVEPRVVFTTRKLLPQAKKMCFLLLNRAMSFMNFRATATVGTWVAHLNGCRTELSNTFPNL